MWLACVHVCLITGQVAGLLLTATGSFAINIMMGIGLVLMWGWAGMGGYGF